MKMLKLKAIEVSIPVGGTDMMQEDCELFAWADAFLFDDSGVHIEDVQVRRSWLRVDASGVCIGVDLNDLHRHNHDLYERIDLAIELQALELASTSTDWVDVEPTRVDPMTRAKVFREDKI